MLRQKNGSYRSYFQQNALNHYPNNICGVSIFDNDLQRKMVPNILGFRCGVRRKNYHQNLLTWDLRSPNSPIYSKLLYATEKFKIKITTLRPYWKKYDQNYSKLLFTTENFRSKLFSTTEIIRTKITFYHWKF